MITSMALGLITAAIETVETRFKDPKKRDFAALHLRTTQEMLITLFEAEPKCEQEIDKTLSKHEAAKDMIENEIPFNPKDNGVQKELQAEK